MIFLLITLGIAFIILFSGAFAYLACKLYIIVIDSKKSDPAPLLGVVYPKDKEE